MKRGLPLVVAAATIAAPLAIPSSAQAVAPAAGVSPQVASVVIYSPTDLQSLHDDTTYWQGAIITLANSIDMTSYTWTTGIGDDTTPFTSTFDGNFKSITNLTVSVSTTASRAAAGLFGVLGTGHDVRDLTVTGDIHSQASSGNSSWYATSGGIAGYAEGGTIRRSTFSGTVEAVNTNINSSRAGGIVGTANGETIVQGMVPISETTVTGTGGDPRVGGLVGQAHGATSISKSVSAAAVLGRDSTGSSATEVGGIIGEMYLSGVSVTDSYALGDVAATRSTETVGYRVDIGGVAGAVFGGGGGAGTGGYLSRIYSVSPISTTNFVAASTDKGALIGSLSDDTVSRAYFDDGILPSAVGDLQSGVVDDTGATAATLQSFTTYSASWPIVDTWESPGTNTWGICDAQSYPYLLWQVSADPCITTNTISGTPDVGQVLTANADTAAADDSLSYQWGWLDSGTFTRIRETPFPTYTVTSSDAGHRMAVRVTNTMGAFVASEVSSPTAPVPLPSPTHPPSAPEDVVGLAGDRVAIVSWSAPASSGSFPISTYQVRSIPASSGCVAAGLTCEITGLTNGTAYSFEVRALNGAGWGPWSSSSEPVTPSPAASIVITGSRGRVEGKPGVIVDGTTTGLVGATVTPWIRFPGQSSYSEGTGTRTVDASGKFTWQRQTGKKIYVIFRAGDLKSNRLVIRY